MWDVTGGIRIVVIKKIGLSRDLLNIQIFILLIIITFFLIPNIYLYWYWYADMTDL